MLKLRVALIFFAFIVQSACGTPTPSFVESDWAVISSENVSALKPISQLQTGTSDAKYYQTVWSSDGKFLAVASSTGVYLVDSATFQVTSVLEAEQNVVSVAFSPDSKLLALAMLQGKWGADTCGTTMVSVWDVFTQTILKTLRLGECDRATFLAFAQDENELIVVLTELEANHIQIWDTVTWNLERDMQVGAGGLWNISPDLSTLMFSSYGWGITFVDVESGEKIYYEGMIASSKAISPNRLFALGSFMERNSYLEIGNVTTLEKLWSIQLNDECARVSSIAFAPEKPILAMGCSIDWKGVNGKIRVYNSSTGNVLTEVTGDFLPDHGLAFSPNGRMLAMTSPAGEVFLWGVPADSR